MDLVTSPTVKMAVEDIRSRIRSGALRKGAYLPTELELATTLKVSRGTVRRAIEILVESGEVVRRPHARPRIGNRVVGPSNGGTEVHVWICRPIADGTAWEFLRGISSGLMGTPYRMVVREPLRFFDEYVKAEERQFLTHLLHDEKAVGAILERDPFADNEDLFAELVANGKHLVFVDIPEPDGLPSDHVGTANVTAARNLTNHLIDLGHRRILCVADIDVAQTTKDRIAGYWRAMKNAGLEGIGRALVAEDLAPYEDAPMQMAGPYVRMVNSTGRWANWAQRVVRDIRNMAEPPTAIFASCDVLAFWLAGYLEGAGYSIPEDIALVGFDWVQRFDDSVNDIVTTAKQDFEGFGSHAADLLLDRVLGRGSFPQRHILLDAPVIVRASSGTVHEPAPASPGVPRQTARLKR